jgi:hypothetical protein
MHRLALASHFFKDNQTAPDGHGRANILVRHMLASNQACPWSASYW